MKTIDPFKHNFYVYDISITDTEINQVKNFLENSKNKKTEEDIFSCLTSYTKLNILNLPLLQNLKKQITNILDENNLVLNDNWGQLYMKGHEHPIHTHENSNYSGIIYLKKNYDHPNSGTWFYSIYGDDNYQFPFTEKKLLLFPSFFPHYVRAVSEDGYRIVISFNSSYKK